VGEDVEMKQDYDDMMDDRFRVYHFKTNLPKAERVADFPKCGRCCARLYAGLEDIPAPRSQKAAVPSIVDDDPVMASLVDEFAPEAQTVVSETGTGAFSTEEKKARKKERQRLERAREREGSGPSGCGAELIAVDGTGVAKKAAKKERQRAAKRQRDEVDTSRPSVSNV
jgi:hypothetical protein